MNKRQQALLQQAKEQGFLLMPYGHDSKLCVEYFRWCKAEIIPAIIVTYHGQSASLDTNTDPVFEGYAMTDTPLFGNPDFTPKPELKERLKALSAKLLASVSRANNSRASVHRTDTIGAYYVGQEAAKEAAKELVDIWQEAKKYIVFEPAQP